MGLDLLAAPLRKLPEMSEVDAYIDQFEGEAKNRLEKMRDIVRAEVPEAEEGIMYGLIGYKLGKNH